MELLEGRDLGLVKVQDMVGIEEVAQVGMKHYMVGEGLLKIKIYIRSNSM